MTQAQRIAKAKFKQAIAYRQKTGVSLKEAFAHIYGKKKVVKKAVKKKIAGPKDSKLIKKELAKKGLKMPHGYATIKRKRKISGVKKKPTEKAILNKIHIVKRNVDKLDEAQHKHMISGMHKHKQDIVKKLNDAISMKKHNDFDIILNTESLKRSIKNKSGKSSIDLQKQIISDQKKYKKEIDTHIKELKKLI